MILLANEEHLVLWVVAGRSGILVLQAQLATDKENTHGKIRRHLGDVPLRDDLTRQILHQPEPHDLAVSRWPEVLILREASAYLRIGDSTLRQKVAAGLIRRTPSKKYLKTDLDAYLAGIR